MRGLGGFGVLLVGVLMTGVVHAAGIHLAPPEPGSFIIDDAGLLFGPDEVSTGALCEQVLADHEIPLVVVTIDSMSACGVHRGSIERFSRTLFEQWGRDPGFAYRDHWRRGILLVVSQGDRKARIELGAAWEGNYDRQCERVMEQLIVPEFKGRRFAYGIHQGVTGLIAMSQGAELPYVMDESTGWVIFIGVSFAIALCLPVLLSYFQESGSEGASKHRVKGRRRKKKGDFVDDDDYRSPSSYDSGSDFGGGGGATGSW